MSEFEPAPQEELGLIMNRLENLSGPEPIQIPEDLQGGEVVKHVSGAYLAERQAGIPHADALRRIDHLMPEVRAAQVAEATTWIDTLDPESENGKLAQTILGTENGASRYLNDRVQALLNVWVTTNQPLYEQLQRVCANAGGGMFYHQELVGKTVAEAQELGALDMNKYPLARDTDVITRVTHGAFVPMAQGEDGQTVIEAPVPARIKYRPVTPSAAS